MKLYCDLHLHSCLSPCGDEDMTPNNIVNMAKLKGLSCIALTDHNTARNCRATALQPDRPAWAFSLVWSFPPPRISTWSAFFPTVIRPKPFPGRWKRLCRQ